MACVVFAPRLMLVCARQDPNSCACAHRHTQRGHTRSGRHGRQQLTDHGTRCAASRVWKLRSVGSVFWGVALTLPIPRSCFLGTHDEGVTGPDGMAGSSLPTLTPGVLHCACGSHALLGVYARVMLSHYLACLVGSPISYSCLTGTPSMTGPDGMAGSSLLTMTPGRLHRTHAPQVCNILL